MSSPGNPSALRAANETRVVRALRQHQELSQADIARDTGLAPATVSNIVKDLVASGLLSTTGGAGRRGATVSISRQAGLVGGIDFGHSHVQVSLGDLGGRVLVTAQEPLSNDHRHEDGLELAHRMLDRLMAAEQDDPPGTLRAIGIGLPAPLRTDGVIDSGSILPGWIGVNAAEAGEKEFGIPTRADNDANLGALAEHALGAGRGTASMAYLKLSSGVGCGLVLDGAVYRGGIGTAGELGHMTMDETGPLCRCGSRGCLEAYVGGTALTKQFAPIRSELSVREFVALANDGDTGAQRLIEDAGRYLGRAAAALANILGPELLVIGGDLSDAGAPLIDGVRDGLRRHALAPVASQVRVERAALGARSSSIGSVLYALEGLDLGAGTRA